MSRSVLSPGAVVPPAVTLAVGWVVTLAVYLSADRPPGHFTDIALPIGMAAGGIAAAAAVLVSWGEIDLSFFGVLALTGYLYVEVVESGVFVGVLVGVLVGLGVGALVGVLRWLTRAPSSLLSLGVGLLLSAAALRLSGIQGEPLREGRIDGTDLPILVGLLFVAVAVAAAALRPGGTGGDGPAGSGGGPGPEVIAGFALSGAAAGAAGAVFVGVQGFVQVTSGMSERWLLIVAAAVAIGGVTRGSGVVGPVGALPGAVAAAMLAGSGALHRWEPGSDGLIMGSVLVVCLVLAYGLRRIIGDPPGSPAGPPPRTF